MAEEVDNIYFKTKRNCMWCNIPRLPPYKRPIALIVVPAVFMIFDCRDSGFHCRATSFDCGSNGFEYN